MAIQQWSTFHISWHPQDAAQSANISDQTGVTGLRNTVTGNMYIMPAKQGGLPTDALTLSYGKRELRKKFVIASSALFGASIVCTIILIVKNVFKSLGCFLPTGSRTLKQRATDFKNFTMENGSLLCILVIREFINIYGIFKPFEAYALLAKTGIAILEIRPFAEAERITPTKINARGFPLHNSKATSENDTRNQLQAIFQDQANITFQSSANGQWGEKLAIKQENIAPVLNDDRLIKLGKVLRNMPNLKSLTITQAISGSQSWGGTNKIYSYFNLLDTNPLLNELTLNEPCDEPPSQATIESLFNTHPNLNKLKFNIHKKTLQDCAYVNTPLLQVTEEQDKMTLLAGMLKTATFERSIVRI
jgi:hypothetical protein